MMTAADGDRLSVLHRRNYAVDDYQSSSDWFEGQALDVVIHAAGVANVDAVERNVEKAWRSNVVGTRHVIDLVSKKNSRFVYISSNAVFDGKTAL